MDILSSRNMKCLKGEVIQTMSFLPLFVHFRMVEFIVKIIKFRFAHHGCSFLGLTSLPRLTRVAEGGNGWVRSGLTCRLDDPSLHSLHLMRSWMHTALAASQVDYSSFYRGGISRYTSIYLYSQHSSSLITPRKTSQSSHPVHSNGSHQQPDDASPSPRLALARPTMAGAQTFDEE